MSVRVMSWVWDQDIPPNIKIVLLAIADCADDDGGNAYPSQETLARKTGYSTRQVKRIVEQLVALNVLSVGKANLPNRRADRQPNLYRVRISAPVSVNRDDLPRMSPTSSLRQEVIESSGYRCYWCSRRGDETKCPDGLSWEVDRLSPGRLGGTYVRENVVLSCRSCNKRRGDNMSSRVDGGTSETERGDTGVFNGGTPVSYEPSLNHQENNLAQLALSVNAGSRFEEFWKVWPKRVGKRAALKSYERALKRATHEQILQGAQEMAALWMLMSEEDRKYVPYPERWLNSDRWADEREEMPAVTTARTPQPDKDCVLCDGSGWVTIDFDANLMDRCECWTTEE